MTPSDRILECTFFVPLRRDRSLSDGAKHKPRLWEWLDEELFYRFGGGTVAPGKYSGFYMDPDTGKKVTDQCYMYIVAIPEEGLQSLRDLLRTVCKQFAQKCVYLSVTGEVEFIRVDDGNSS